MTAIAPGANPSRLIRPSSLLFGWRASDVSLDAYTGQVGTLVALVNPGAVPSTIQGRNGAVITAGEAQPRFEQVAARGNITRLVLEGEVTGQDVEQLYYPWPLKIMAMSVWVRIWPFYAAGSSQAQPWYAITLGNDTGGGGRLTLRRTGTNWEALRQRGAASLSSSFSESGSTTYPIDLLITLSAAGVLQLLSRDAVGLIQNGTASAADANMTITTESWAGSILQLNGITGLVLPGGQWRYENIKIARGVQTMTSIDLLS